MHIISRKVFQDAAKQFPNERTAIDDCYRVLKNGTFKTPDELRQVFPSLVNLKDQDRRWVINISRSHLRLEAFIDFKHNRLCVRHIFTSDQSERGQSIAITDEFGDNLDANQCADAEFEAEKLADSPDDVRVIRLINAMFVEAIRKNASDVHIEPSKNRLAIRYRVDGLMQKMFEPPSDIAPFITSHLKVMAKIDIAEQGKPADGRIRLLIDGSRVDVLIYIVPFVAGERVVLRILQKTLPNPDTGSR